MKNIQLQLNWLSQCVKASFVDSDCLLYITSCPARRCSGFRAPRWPWSLRSTCSAQLSRFTITQPRDEQTPFHVFPRGRERLCRPCLNFDSDQWRAGKLGSWLFRSSSFPKTSTFSQVAIHPSFLSLWTHGHREVSHRFLFVVLDQNLR